MGNSPTQVWHRYGAYLSQSLPSQCAVCHAWPAQAVCEACISRFAQPRARCLRCAVPVPPGVAQCGDCLAHPPPLDACFAAVSYDFPWSDRVASFKFQDRPSWSKPFAQLMRSMPFVEPALEQAQLILPMPLSRQRLRERGYNQAWELARQLVRPAGPTGQLSKQGGHKSKLRSSLLLRITDTVPQAGLNRAERLRNLRTAFAVDPLQATLLQSVRVVLVDDVMTSGASLHAAALALRSAGAAHITGLVFARTDPRP